MELPRPVRVARHPQVVSVPDIASELDGVTAANVRPIVHKLVLVLAFGQRAVALIVAQGVAKLEVLGARDRNIEEWHSGGVRVIDVQAGNSGVLGGCRAEPAR